MPDYGPFLTALASEGQPSKAFEALETLTKELVGVKLFTVMTSDERAKTSERVYSNMPDAYPVSGTKPYHDNVWSDITLRDKQTFVANTIDDIAKVFDDHELIRSLGCESVINVPIVIGGTVIGTINCLHDEGFYTQDRVAAAEALKLPGAICMMLHETKKGTL
jgi:GAF domain-containing protein